MSKKIQIYPKSIPNNIPSSLLDNNGNIYIDFYPNFEVRLTKKRGEFSINNGVKGEGISNTNIPKSKINKLLFEKLINPLIIGQEYNGLSVFVKIGSKFLQEDNICVLEKNNDYKISIRKSSTHWRTALKNISICDALDESDTFELTLSNLQTNWANPTTSLTYFPVVNFGRWIESSDRVSVEDFRPFINVNLFLKKLFCKVGWNYQSNLISETIFGNSLIAYLLKNDYYNFEGQGVLHNFKASTTSVQNFTNLFFGDVIFQDDSTGDNSDVGNNYDNLTGVYTHNDSLPICLEASAIGEACVTGNQVGVEIQIIHFDSSFVEVDSVSTVNPLNTPPFCFDFNISKKFFLEQGDTVRVRVKGEGTIEGTFSGKVCDKRIYNGDTLILKEMLDPSITGMDFVSGIVQMFNLKVTEDKIYRTVYLDIPNDWETPHAESVAGYFKDEVKNWEDKVGYKSGFFSSPKNKTFKNCRLEFKNSTDDYIQDQDFPDDNPYASRTVFLGDSNTSETEPKTNPLFEATLDDIDTGISSTGVSIPQMLDNNDGGNSTNINPRILYAYGLVEQFSNGSEVANLVNIEGGEQSSFPFASQCTDTENSSGIIANLVFGNKDNDLYSIAYEQELVEKRFGAGVSFELQMNFDEYIDIDFFKYIHQVYYEGRTYFLRAIEISKHIPYSKKMTRVRFITIPKQKLCAIPVEETLCDLFWESPATGEGSSLLLTILGDTSCQSLPIGHTIDDIEDCVETILNNNNITFGTVEIISPTNSTSNIVSMSITQTTLQLSDVEALFEDFGISPGTNSCDQVPPPVTCDFVLTVLNSGQGSINSILLNGNFICVAPSPWDVSDWTEVQNCLQSGLTAAGYIFETMSFTELNGEYATITIEDTDIQGGDLVIQMTESSSVQLINCG